MIEINSDDLTFPEDWPEWVINALKNLCSIGAPEINEFFNGSPESVTGIFETQLDKAFSVTKRPLQKKNGPQYLGSLLGSLEKQIASPEAIAAKQRFYEVIERIESVDPASVVAPTRTEIEKELKETPPSDPKRQKLKELIDFLNERNCSLADLMEQMSGMREHLLLNVKPVVDISDQVFTKQRELIAHCLKTASEQSYEEKTEFIDAYSKAKKLTKIPDPQHMSPQEKMFTATTMFWPDLANLESASEYRDWVINIFGKPALFNPAMVNQNCQRKELHFKDGPGRPKNKTIEK